MTKRLVDWPSWMTSWSQCVDRAKSLSQMYGFSPPLGLEPKYKNEVHGSSDHYHVALSFRCAHENGIAKLKLISSHFLKTRRQLPRASCSTSWRETSNLKVKRYLV